MIDLPMNIAETAGPSTQRLRRFAQDERSVAGGADVLFGSLRIVALVPILRLALRGFAQDDNCMFMPREEPPCAMRSG
jgi:hypothetical protein